MSHDTVSAGMEHMCTSHGTTVRRDGAELIHSSEAIYCPSTDAFVLCSRKEIHLRGVVSQSIYTTICDPNTICVPEYH